MGEVAGVVVGAQFAAHPEANVELVRVPDLVFRDDAGPYRRESRMRLLASQL